MTDDNVCQRTKDLFTRHESWFKVQVWDKIDKRREFWTGDRFDDPDDKWEKDRRLRKIRGQESSAEARHVVAKVTEKPRTVTAKPRDRNSDPDSAEAAVNVVKWALERFDKPFERALMASRKEAIGIVWLDYDPDDQLYPYKYRNIAGDRCMWDPAFWDDPHHPDCGWFLEIYREDTEKAKKEYGVDWLISDYDAQTQTGRSDKPILNYSGAYGPVTFDDKKTTLWKCWYKKDNTEGETKLRDEQPMPESDHYMSCAAGCGYRSETQGVRESKGIVEPLPEMEPPASEDNPGGGCPGINGVPCGGMLEKVEVKQTADVIRKYANGRRLVIMAPNGPEDQPLVDDKWPIPTQRSFPAFFNTPYVEPGWSDCEEHYDSQLAADTLRTIGIQRVFDHQTYFEVPSDGRLMDANGKRFQFRNNQRNVMYRDMTAPTQGGLGELKVHPGIGLDPNWAVVLQYTLQSLTQYTAQADFGTSEENTRDIAVGTTKELVKQAETPTAHWRRRINRDLGDFYGPVFDTVQATLTPEMAARIDIEGMSMVVAMSGDSLPGYDFVLEDTPEFTGTEEAKQRAWEGMVQTDAWATQAGVDPVMAIEAFADLHGIPPGVVKKFTKLLQQRQMMQEQMGMGMGLPSNDQAGGAVPGEASGDVEPGTDFNQLDALGMEPMAAA